MNHTLLTLAAATMLFGCSITPEAMNPDSAPYVVVLGTAQDGGLPHIGCRLEHCEDARNDPDRRRLVTSLLLVDPRSGARYLFDASPDLAEQEVLARAHADRLRDRPIFDGVFLTHAHMGHYTGLLQLGPEALGAKGVPVHGSRRMVDFLTSNGPWSLLVEGGCLEPRIMKLGEKVELAPDLSVSSMRVPHRDELTDTLAFVIHGPERSVLFLPDIDKWERWTTQIESVIETVDLALLDGTFFDDGELPGRDMASIPHPFIVESLERFAGLPAEERAKVVFIHLNHSNPAGWPETDAVRSVRDAGMSVAAEGQVLGL